MFILLEKVKNVEPKVTCKNK